MPSTATTGGPTTWTWRPAPASPTIGSASNGRASNRKTASSPARRSTTTAGWSTARSTRPASFRHAAPLHPAPLVRPHRRLAARRRGAALPALRRRDRARARRGCHPRRHHQRTQHRGDVRHRHRARACPRCAHGLPLPDPRVTETLIEVHHAARAPTQGRHPKVAVGWGVSVQDCHAEPGAEHLLADYTRPRDEVFLQAAARRRLGGRADLHPHPQSAAGPDGRPVEVTTPRPVAR